MPKTKIVRGAIKHFRKVGEGGFKREHASLRHTLTKEATERKRHPRPKAIVSRDDLDLVITYLPYV